MTSKIEKKTARNFFKEASKTFPRMQEVAKVGILDLFERGYVHGLDKIRGIHEKWRN